MEGEGVLDSDADVGCELRISLEGGSVSELEADVPSGFWSWVRTSDGGGYGGTMDEDAIQGREVSTDVGGIEGVLVFFLGDGDSDWLIG